MAPALQQSRDSENQASPAQAIRQTPAGHWVITGDTHISKWVEEKCQLQHDFQTLPIILEEIPVGGVVVDVGANIGDTTAPFLERVGPDGTVVAFEPDSDAFECLKRNCPKAVVHNLALSVYRGQSFETLSRDANAGSRHMIKSEQGQRVQSSTLDAMAFFERCDLIKIDVEGYELKVLQGAEVTLRRFRPKLIVEINESALRQQGTTSAQVFTWLSDHGYQAWPLVPPNLEQDLPQYDVLCRPVDTPKLRARAENSSEITPWQDKAESIEEIKRLCGRLKRFCTSPAYIAKVRSELKSAKVTR